MLLRLGGRVRPVTEHRAVDLVHAAGIATIQTLLATPVDQRDPDLAGAMLEAVLGQILLDQQERPDPAPIATAVASEVLAPPLEAVSGPERRLLLEWIDRAITVL